MNEILRLRDANRAAAIRLQLAEHKRRLAGGKPKAPAALPRLTASAPAVRHNWEIQMLGAIFSRAAASRGYRIDEMTGILRAGGAR